MVGRAGPDTSAAGIVLSPVEAGDGAVTVSDAHLLFTAEFSQTGDDLLLTGSDGTTQIISGYFTAEVPPPLLSPDGAVMSPDLVAALVGPRVPGLLYAQAGGAPVAEAIGQVETLTGNAQVIRAGVAVDLAVGDPVFQGDVVQTGTGSTLGLTFIDETVFSLSGGARMVLSSMVYDPDGSANSMLFDLVQGTFVFVTGQVAPTGNMRIETPVATIGVRGTVPITKISAIDGSTLYSIGEDPEGGVGIYGLFDKLSGTLLTNVSDLNQLVRIQSAGGPFFESIKTPGEQAIDQALVARAHDIYGQAQQRLGEERRGEIEDGEFEQASDEPNTGADTDPFAEPPLETAAPPVTGPVTSGGLGVDEPEFGEEQRTNTDISSSSTQVTETTSPQTPTPPRQAPGGPGSPPGDSNSPPIATADGAVTAGSAPVVIAVLGNDIDPEGNALSIFLVTQGSNGSVAINPDGTLTYTPAPGFFGADSFTYTVSDGAGGFATTTVSISAGNSPPVAADDNAETTEDTPTTITVLNNDSDSDGGTLSVSAVTQGANGGVVVNSDGTITYTPNANFNGDDSFTYTISDGQGGSDTATVSVSVGAVNDPPVAANDAGSTAEDTSATFSVLNNDSDADGDTLSVSAVTQGTNGSVAINSDGTVTYTPNADFNGADSFTYTISDGQGGSDTATVDVTVNPVGDPPVAANDEVSVDEDTPVTISVLANDSDADGDTLSVTAVTQGTNGSVVANSDGTITYTPNANFSGADSFTYTVADGQGGFDTATVNVTVDAVNDPPVAANDEAGTSEDMSVTISVLDNDNDPDGGTLSVTAVTQGTNGSVVANSDGTITYTPNANFSGADSFTYTISDGQGGSDTATVDVSVGAVNDPPVLGNNSLTVSEGGVVTLTGDDLSATDLDSDDAALVFTISNVQGGHFEFGQTPGVAIASFTQAQVVVEAVRFVHDGGEAAPSYTVTVSDGTASDIGSAVIDFTNVNDTPVVTGGNGEMDEGASAQIPAALLSASDAETTDPAQLTYTVTGISNGAVHVNGAAANSFTQAQVNGGLVSFVHDGSESNIASFTVTVADPDGGVSAPATFDFAVNPVNDPPAVDLNGASGASFTEGGAAVIVDDNLLVSDPDSSTLASATVTIDAMANPGLEALAANTGGTSIVASFNQQTGILSLSGTDSVANYQQVLRSVTYQNLAQDPTAGGNSPQRNIRFVVNDGAASSAAVLAVVALVAQNDAPTLTLPFTIISASGFEADVIDDSGAAVAAADPDAPSVVVTLDVGNGTLSLGQIGGLTFQTGDGTDDTGMSFSGTLANVNAALDSLAYQSDRGFIGDETVNVTVNDQGGTGAPGPLSATGTVDIAVGDRSGDVLFDNITLTVGNSAVGRFALVGGRTFSASELIVGNLNTGDGSVVIDGFGSLGNQVTQMSLSGTRVAGGGASAIIGREGHGELRVLDGADLVIDGGQGFQPGFQVGQLAGGDGLVVVSGFGSSITVNSFLDGFDSGYIAVGRSGTGRLEILNGATVQNSEDGTTVIGGSLDSQVAGVGTVLVQGSSANVVSTLNAGGRLVIGMQIDSDTGLPISSAASGTGTLIIGEFGTVNVFEAYIGQNGRVEGTGTLGAATPNANFNVVETILDGGFIDPGFSAGTIHLSGNLTLVSGTLEMELGGTAAGLSDLIEVAGEADVQGGLVDFTLIGGYLPAVGDSIDFLTAGEGLTGSPENLSSAVHGVTQDFDYQLDFRSSAASFTALSAAQSGNSTIYHGGALDDTYAGGAGDDVLRGGTGADTLSGGAGSDLFVLAPGDGGASLAAADVLSDFEDGVDLIGLAGGLQFSDLTIGASGAGSSTISVATTGEILALVEGIVPSSLDTDDFTAVM